MQREGDKKERIMWNGTEWDSRGREGKRGLRKARGMIVVGVVAGRCWKRRSGSPG